MADHFSKITALARTLLVLILTLAVWHTAAAQSEKAGNTRCKAGSSVAACKSKDAAQASPSPAAGSGSAVLPAAAAFPFPTDDSKGNVNATGSQPSPATGKGLPAMPTGAVPDPPSSSERPLRLPPGYPGSSSSGGGDAAGSETGSSSSRPPDDDDVAPTTAAPDAPVRSSALKDLGSRGDTSEARAKLEQTRVADDLKVGNFYMKDGNAQGAYLRFKDAADHAPDDADVHFNLAEAAGKLKKQDEAVLNYQEYLRLDAGGDHDKASRKALSRLGVEAR